jgi:hypothetical protein
MEIVFVPDSFKVNKRGLAVGEIFVSHNGRSFPEPHWIDFVDNVIAHWGWGLTLLKSQHQVTLEFFDGPQRIVVDNNNGSATFLFLGKSSGIPDGTLLYADIRPFVVSYVAAADYLIKLHTSHSLVESQLLSNIRGYVEVLIESCQE